MRVIKPTGSLTTGSLTRAGSATYVDPAGVLRTAAANVPRYQDTALMVEPAVTNLVTYSQAFDNVSWARSNVLAPTASTDVAPDATTTAEQIIEASGAAATHIVGRTITVAANTSHIFSVFLKAAGRSKVVVYFGQAGSPFNRFGALVDLVAGTVSAANSGTPGTLAQRAVQVLADGWLRVMLGGVIDAATTAAYIEIRLHDGTSTAYAGDGASGVLAWGAQLEVGTRATSYIATTGSPAARVADVYTPGVISSIPETDHAAWAAGTAYSLGDRVVRTTTHRIYQRTVAGTTATPPEDDGVNWLAVGPTNAWAMLDGEISTASSTSSGRMEITIAPGRVTALALFGLVGSAVSMVVVDGDTGVVMYRKSAELDAAIITDWYQYAYSDFRQRPDWVVTDLPPYANARISISINGTVAACAALVVGELYSLGGTLMGPRLSITDYSRKETDEFGATSFVRRAFAKRLAVEVMFTQAELDTAMGLLSDLRAMPAVYIPADGPNLQAMLIYGWYRDFGITVAYATRCLCSLELEGLT